MANIGVCGLQSIDILSVIEIVILAKGLSQSILPSQKEGICMNIGKAEQRSTKTSYKTVQAHYIFHCHKSISS